MGVKKAARAKKPAWRRFAIIGGVVVATLAIVFVALYFSNRPNYRDLQKEYQRISAFIPSDWQLVGESSNKGTWGLFCLQIEGSECPYIDSQYSLAKVVDSQTDLATIDQILARAEYIVNDQNITHCVNSDSRFYCQESGNKDNYQLQISVGLSDNEKILRVHIGR